MTDGTDSRKGLLIIGTGDMVGSKEISNQTKKIEALEYVPKNKRSNEEMNTAKNGLNHFTPSQITVKISRLSPESLQAKLTKASEPDTRQRPSNHLCSECLKIVQRAKPMTLEYVDVTGGPNISTRTALHVGAKDGNGTFGYVHNETSLRRQPPIMNFTGNRLRQACLQHDDDFRMLQKIEVASNDELELQRLKLRAASVQSKRERIFCMIYSTESGKERIQRIRETWGQKCDGFMVASNVTDPTYDAVNILHKGVERYGNMWQKVRTMWSYAYDNYYEKYDWFHIGGDDMYLIVENLRLYLESEEIKTAANGGTFLPNGTETTQVPLYLGCRFKIRKSKFNLYNTGGPGTTLNKAALKALVVNGLPNFEADRITAAEDVMTAYVLRHLKVYPYETKDESGSERYNALSPGRHYRMSENRRDWFDLYWIDAKLGIDHSATRSVAFHYVAPDDMYRIHALLYDKCPNETRVSRKNITWTPGSANRNKEKLHEQSKLEK